MLQGTNFLVTGGCGSVGSPLVERLLSETSAVVYVFDNNEHGLFEHEQRLSQYGDRGRFVLGDVRERDQLDRVMPDVDVVLHTAGLKHVPLNEHHPYEAVKTNVEGTQQVIESARQHGVETVIGLSTDKAVAPTSVMGATKMLAERLIVAANWNGAENEPTFGCVRLGNVVGTNGSVVKVFDSQIAAGGPVTLTDPEMTRFVLSIEGAVDFILDAVDDIAKGQVLVPKMDAMAIADLAEVMVEELGDGEPIEIEVVGHRPGERLHEYLVATSELDRVIEEESRFVITSEIDSADAFTPQNGSQSAVDHYSSNHATHLSKDEIRAFLRENGVV